MRPVHQFTVTSSIPESLRDLEVIAANLRWAWNRQLAAPFDQLDGSPTGQSWRQTGQHPVDLVRRTSPACWEALADDAGYVDQVVNARESLDQALTGSSWFQRRNDQEHSPLRARRVLLAGVRDHRGTAAVLRGPRCPRR